MTFIIDKDLSKVIKASWFTVEKGVYVYTKVSEVLNPEKHLIITRDSDEITVVTKSSNLQGLGAYERNLDNWILLNIKCGNPFYCEGFLASIASMFASEKMDITLTSTYTNDYLMIQEHNKDRAITLLISLGFTYKSDRS